MKKPSSLQSSPSEQESIAEVDVVVIGAGIYGAWVTYDLVRRGFSVCLLEKEDFGHATSFNSQKILHGGLRYLQHADFKRMRDSIRERSVLLRIAPHLTRPLPVLIPLSRSLHQRPLFTRLAFLTNDIMSWDRNHRLPPCQHLPRGRLLSAAETAQIGPIAKDLLPGGAGLFYDARIEDTERLLLSILWSARSRGAQLSNYTEVTGISEPRGGRNEVEFLDRALNKRSNIRCSFVVNTAGPWVPKLTRQIEATSSRLPPAWIKGMILVTRQILRDHAVGIRSASYYRDDDALLDRGARYFFITPWKDQSLVGTHYEPFQGHPDELRAEETEILHFLEQLRESTPLEITRKDVRYAFCGLLPGSISDSTQPQFQKKAQIIDHTLSEPSRNAVSVVGVKYTTARNVAARTAALVEKKLRNSALRSSTDASLLDGAVENPSEFFRREWRELRKGPLDRSSLRYLISQYGTQYREILDGSPEDEWKPFIEGSPVLVAEIRHCVESEAAQHLDDIIFRRTILGQKGNPGKAALRKTAHLMGEMLHWDAPRIDAEISRAYRSFRKRCDL